MSEIDINAFVGMNNLKPSEGFVSNKGVSEPRIIANADVNANGQVNKRAGKTLFVSLPGAHSLWACPSCMLVAANKVLYRVVNGLAVSLCAITGNASEPLSYAEAHDRIYISNRYWKKKFNPVDNSLSDWGIALPPGPMLLTTNGNLPAGVYNVCMTNVVDGELSGNGPITPIELTVEGGIQVLNRPSGAIAWATDANEPVFYNVGAVNVIVDIPTIEPLLSFLCGPPPDMSEICYAFGRMWGAIDKVLYYSEPYNLGLFKLAGNVFEFESDTTLIARVPTGLFIGMEDQTRFLQGAEPDQMVESFAGSGSVKGTLAYCNNVPYLADKLGTPEKVFVDVPIWRTADGIVAGNASGRLFNLTKDKLKTGTVDKGASLYRNLNGAFQYLTSSLISSGAVDAETIAVFEDGAIPANNIINKIPTSTLGFTEEVTCEVWRNGVLITE